MVVRHLETFVENEIPGAFRKANLKDLIEKESEGVSNPSVILDASGIAFFLKDASRVGYIGKFKEISKVIQKFVDKIISCGVTLIVVLRGNDAPTNIWHYHQTHNLKLYTKEFEMLAKNEDPNSCCEFLSFNFLKICARTTLAGISRNNYKVLQSLKSTHEEIAGIAKKFNCLAVIGQDSNYLIYEHIKIVVSTRKLDEETLDCYIYDRKVILDYLGLKSNQLPIFATLCGNDFVSPYCKNIRHLHIKCKETHSNLFLGIADFVRSMGDLDDLDEYLLKLTRRLLCHRFFLHESLRTYLNPQTSLNSKDKLNLADVMKQNCKITVQLHRIVEKKIMRCAYLYECENNETMTKILRHLRAKIYGILFYEDHPQCVHEYCLTELITHQMEDGKLKFTPFAVYSVKPKGEHPGSLMSLWTEDSPRINKMRWNLFCEAVSRNLTHSTLSCVPVQLIIPVTALHYLAAEIPNTTPYKVFYAQYEVEAFLLVALKVYVNAISLEKDKFVRPTVRSFSLACMFEYCIKEIHLLNEACGSVIPYVDTSHYHFFDLPLFYYIHDKMEKGAKWNEFLEDDFTLEVSFATLLEIIMNKEMDLFN